MRRDGRAPMTGALRAVRRIAVAAVLAIVLIPFVGGPADACTCNWGGPFLKVAPRVQFIVRVRIAEYHGRGGPGTALAMDVAVLEQLKGPALPREIRIWGDNGALCRPYVSQFPLGSEWILAVYPQRREIEGSPDYVIPGCGAYWLRVEGERVRGQIRPGVPPEQEDSLDAVRAAVARALKQD